MDEIRFKPFCPYNIILATQSRTEARWNISTCESYDLRFSNIFLSKGTFQRLEKLQVRVFRGLYFLSCQCGQLFPYLLFSSNSSLAIILFVSLLSLLELLFFFHDTKLFYFIFLFVSLFSLSFF
jgi:hypothetical protein